MHPFCNFESRARTHAVLVNGLYALLGNPASSTTKTGLHDIAEILLKVPLSTINQSIINDMLFYRKRIGK